jgi:hypothetical protein
MRLRVFKLSRQQAVGGKLVGVGGVRHMLSEESGNGNSSAIHQRQNRNGLLLRSFPSHAWERSVA